MDFLTEPSSKLKTTHLRHLSDYTPYKITKQSNIRTNFANTITRFIKPEENEVINLKFFKPTDINNNIMSILSKKEYIEQDNKINLTSSNVIHSNNNTCEEDCCNI